MQSKCLPPANPVTIHVVSYPLTSLRHFNRQGSNHQSRLPCHVGLEATMSPLQCILCQPISIYSCVSIVNQRFSKTQEVRKMFMRLLGISIGLILSVAAVSSG